WHRAARPRLGAVPRAGAGAARPLRRAVADPRPPPDRRGPARAVAGGGRTADGRRGGARPRRRTGPAAAPHPPRARGAARPAPAPAGGPGLPLLATPHVPLLRPGRIRPLYRRPRGAEPNLAPGLTAHLAARLGGAVDAADVLAWILAVARPGPDGPVVPLTAD